MTDSNFDKNYGYEKRDVNVMSMIIVGFSIVAFVVLSLIFLNEYFLSEKEQVIYDAVLKPESVKLADLRAKEDSVLNGYHLLDSAKAIYGIPIDSAMNIIITENSLSNK